MIEGAQQIKVKLSDDTEYTAKLIGTDSQSDIAVLKIDATGLTPRCSAIPTVCRWANCPSRWQPLGTLSNTATDGIISGLDREVTAAGNTVRPHADQRGREPRQLLAAACLMQTASWSAS